MHTLLPLRRGWRFFRLGGIVAAGLAWTVAAGAIEPVAPSRPATTPPAGRAPVRATGAPAPASAPAVTTPAAPAPAAGLQPVFLAAPPAPLTTVAAPSGIIDIQADDLAYDAARKLVIARGNVMVTRGTNYVSADYAEVDTATEQVYARGNILIQYMGTTWRGQEATHNFKTGAGDFGAFEAYSPPYHVAAGKSRRLSFQLVEMEDVILTTCDLTNLEYSVRARSATLEDNRMLRAKNVRFQFGPVPVFWMPYVKADIEEMAKFKFTLGASSRMGVFLLTAYEQPIDDVFTSVTHFDVREKRGVALGQDLRWEDPETNYVGEAGVYYLNDQAPWRDAKQRREREGQIEKDRYWLRLEDVHSLTDRDYLRTRVNYVSDPWMLHDFFDDTYQKNVQPENRVVLAHRGDMYSTGVELNSRLNDFYGNVNRLPEVYFDVNRQPIFETGLFYESENTLTYLDRVFPENSTTNAYDEFRLDTKHMAYYPTYNFDFLSVIPRAGYRGTYFSKTKEQFTVTNVVVLTNSLGEPRTNALTGEVLTSNSVEQIDRDAAAAWRHLPELGVESSFKAFGVLYEGPTGIEEDRDLRHVAEPYIDYTYVPEPEDEVLAGKLWQYDAIDTLGMRNDIRLGMRNYLQTRRGYPPQVWSNGVLVGEGKAPTHDLIYADVYTTYLLDPVGTQDPFYYLGFYINLLPFSWLKWQFDGQYDTVEDEITTFKSQVEVTSTNLLELEVDYRYQYDPATETITRNSVAGDLTLFPEQKWSLRVYARMDIEESFVEEHSYYLIHRTRCLGIGVGGRIRPSNEADEDDDYTIWFYIWPLAFPDSTGSDIGGSD